MKKTFLTSLYACAVALAFVATAAAQNVVQGKATVVRISGDARFSTGNGVWQPLKVGDVLKPGSVIQTGLKQGSYVDLVLNGEKASASAFGSSSSSTSSATPVANYNPKAEQNVVRVFENSALGVDKLTTMHTGADTVTETQLDLKAGRVFGTVKKMSAASKYEVKLPNGVAGIRGTTYEITSDGVVRVSNGSVVIAYVAADGTVTTKVVSAGQQFDARTGEITPIDMATKKRMETIQQVLTTTPNVNTQASFTVDRTVHYVSPFEDDQGEDNDDQ